MNTFETVDGKTSEAEFFLSKMCEAGLNTFEFRCYFSAFLASTRTITMALQRFFHIPGLEEWYNAQREKLASDDLSKYFIQLRNDHIHGGQYPVRGYMSKGKEITYYFPNDNKKQALPTNIVDDIVAASREYFIKLLDVVYDCYVALGQYIDPQQHYTKENYPNDINAAECETYGWIRTSLINEGFSEDDRWHELRGSVGECEINHLFHSYLGKVTPQPIMPEEHYDFELSDEDRGWSHIPAGFSSVEEYRESIR